MALLQEIKVPLISVNDTSLTVVEVFFKTGDQVMSGDIILVLETSKTTYDVVSETEGFIEYKCIAGGDYNVNETIVNIYNVNDDIVKQEAAISGVISDNTGNPAKQILWDKEVLFSNEAKLLIEKNEFNRDLFKNTDFVTKRDVEEYFNLNIKTNKAPVPKTVKLIVAEERVNNHNLSKNKKREIEYLSSVQLSGLTSTLNISVDTTGILSSVNKSLRYLKNSLLPIIIYESSRLLKKYPLLNAFFNEDQIVSYKYFNIGFAIDAGKGLKVLNIENANSRNINEIEAKIMDLSELYLEDRLGYENLSDVTFTVTDLSSEGISFFQPLINNQNSAILGVSAIDEKLDRTILSITFDHRVTEGKYAAVFLKELKERMESYRSSNNKEHLGGIICFKCNKSLAEDLSSIGFVKCITTAGNEDLICQSCFKGF